MRIAQVDAIEKVGTDGFYQAEITVSGHIAAVQVIGENLSQCIERTYIIMQAFNWPTKGH